MAIYKRPFPDLLLSSDFGWRDLAGGTFHEGIDYRLGMRTPLPAIASGVVVDVGETRKFGRFVRVAADVGGFYGWHACDSVTVNIGERVELDQIIALSGATGFWTTGPHGHLQCSLTANPNTYRNPWDVLGDVTTAVIEVTPILVEEEDDDMNVMVGIQQLGKPEGWFDWYVADLGARTYWHVSNKNQSTALQNTPRLTVLRNQPASYLHGFREVKASPNSVGA